MNGTLSNHVKSSPVEPGDIHVEVCLRRLSQRTCVEQRKTEFLTSILERPAQYNWTPMAVGAEDSGRKECRNGHIGEGDDDWRCEVKRVVIGTTSRPDGEALSLSLETLLNCPNLHFYSPSSMGGMPQELSPDGGDGGGDAPVIGSHQWELPCEEFDSLWEQLHFESELKAELLAYSYAMLRLCDLGVDTGVISMNRLVLLHGPPGTGKTTLCRALSQRLSIQLGKRFKRAVFVEVNSHSLFSKWFSESGKLVARMFERVEELAAQRDCLVFVLVDEVESLTMGRNSAFSGSDPSDSVRAVNAVLTQLDKVRRHPNVLLLATSNISTALDPAFVDRVDISRHVGNPSANAISKILSAAVTELLRVGAVRIDCDGEVGAKLAQLSSSSCVLGMSGRSAKKLALLAYSRMCMDGNSSSLSRLLCELDRALDYLVKEKSSELTSCQRGE